MKRLVFLSLLLIAGLPKVSLAQMTGNPDLDRLGRGRKYFWSVEAGYSHFFPQQSIYRDNYGLVNPGAIVRAGIGSHTIIRDMLGLDRKETGALQFSIGAGYNYSSRKDITALPDLEDRIHSIPLDVTLTYHARYSPKQWVWPSFGAGADFDIFVHKVSSKSVSALDDTTKGMKYGWHAEAQLNLSLNRFDRYASTTSRRAGLTNTIVFGRGRWRSSQTPGGAGGPGISTEGIRFTGWLIDTGIGFHFR